MADSKQQVPLNGGYYGPPIPPRQTHRRVGRHSRCGPCCLLCTLLKFIVSLIVILGIVVLVLWLVFRPNRVTVYVDNASLTQFNLGTNNTLQYNLTLDMSVRNPNKRIAIYYDYIEARALYDGSRFGFTTLPTFFQEHKNTTMLHPDFHGQALALGDSVNTTFTREKGEGNFYVEVKLNASVRLKVWFIKTGHYKPKVDCMVKLPVPTSGSSVPAFEMTKCDVDFF